MAVSNERFLDQSKHKVKAKSLQTIKNSTYRNTLDFWCLFVRVFISILSDFCKDSKKYPISTRSL